MTRRFILLSTVVLGASAMTTQLVLMRELWEALSGNELVVGITLGSWLLLTGLGASLTRRFPIHFSADKTLGLALAILALLPFILILVIRAGRNLLFLHGASVDAMGAIGASLLVFSPYCLLSGALLPLLALRLADMGGDDAFNLRSVYVADTVGAAAGGGAFSFLLAPFLDPFSLLLPFAVFQLVMASIAVPGRLRWRMLALAAAFPLIALILWGDLDLERRSTGWQHPGETVLQQSPSPYGRLVVTKSSDQFAFYSQGVPWLASANTEEVEESAHFALAQRPDAHRVLLLGGLVSGVAREVLRYPNIEYVVGVEQDPAVLAAGRNYARNNIDDPRLRIVQDDGRNFLRTHSESFDVIIVTSPDPSSALLNRVHTVEFYREVRRRLAPGAVFAITTGRYANAVSPELSLLLSCERSTLEAVFQQVLLLPGGRIHFLASDAPLYWDLAPRIEAAGVKPLFVTRNALNALFAPDRLADLERASLSRSDINQDFNPTLYRLTLRHWISQFDGVNKGWLYPALLLVLLGTFLTLQNAPAKVLFVGGFSATTLEMVLLLGFQNLYGTLYRQTGLFVAVFMIGLALGCGASVKRWRMIPGFRSRPLRSCSLLLALMAALIPVLLHATTACDSSTGSMLWGQILLLCSTLILAAGIGLLFSFAALEDSSGSTESKAARLFTADLLGASLGAWISSAWLIPAIGFTPVCLLVAALNLLAGALSIKRYIAPS